MLHIVLLILKILGIILGILAGLLVLLFLFLLLIPVFYQGRLVVKEEITGFFRIRILFPMLQLSVTYREGKPQIKLRFFGIPVWRGKGPPEGKEKKPKKKKKEPKKPKGFIEKIKYTFRRFCVKIKKIWHNSKEAAAIFQADATKLAIGDIKRELMQCIRIICPKKMEGFIEFGTGEPASTGQILGLVSVFYFAYFQNIKLYPNFEEKTLLADLFLKGHFTNVKLLGCMLRLFRNRRVTRLFGTIKNLGGSKNGREE